MITEPTFINNVWYRSAYTLLLATILQTGVNYIYLGSGSYLNLSYLYYMFFIIFTCAALVIIGKVKGRETRIINYIKIYGLFAAFPLTGLTTSPLYFIFKNKNISICNIVFFIIIVILISYQKIKNLSNGFGISKSNSTKINNQIFLMKNFSIKNTNQKDLIESIISKLVTIASYLIPLGYLVAKLFFTLDETGHFILILIAVLATPLSIYSISELLGGAYIWYFKIKMLEKKSKVEYHIFIN